ncbi:MAG: transposase [Nitrospira sp.]|nr:transposase [Nitrospira sp.]
MHAGVVCKSNQRKKLERLCRYITRPAISEQRLSLGSNGNVMVELKTPYDDGTSHVVLSPMEGDAESLWVAWLRWFRSHGLTSPGFMVFSRPAAG